MGPTIGTNYAYGTPALYKKPGQQQGADTALTGNTPEGVSDASVGQSYDMSTMDALTLMGNQNKAGIMPMSYDGDRHKLEDTDKQAGGSGSVASNIARSLKEENGKISHNMKSGETLSDLAEAVYRYNTGKINASNGELYQGNAANDIAKIQKQIKNKNEIENDDSVKGTMDLTGIAKKSDSSKSPDTVDSTDPGKDAGGDTSHVSIGKNDLTSNNEMRSVGPETKSVAVEGDAHKGGLDVSKAQDVGLNVNGKNNKLEVITDDKQKLTLGGNGWEMSKDGNNRLYKDANGNELTVTGDAKVLNGSGEEIDKGATRETPAEIPAEGVPEDELTDTQMKEVRQNAAVRVLGRIQTQNLMASSDKGKALYAGGDVYNEILMEDVTASTESKDPKVRKEARKQQEYNVVVGELTDPETVKALSNLDGKAGNLNVNELEKIKKRIEKGETLEELIAEGKKA